MNDMNEVKYREPHYSTEFIMEIHRVRTNDRGYN